MLPRPLSIAVVLLAASGGALAGCRSVFESEAERACRAQDALLGGDTAQLLVGATRQFEATGFQPGTRTGTCLGTIRGGFRYSVDAPAIASVGATDGWVTALTVGTTTLRAHWTVNGVTYRGTARLVVLPAAEGRHLTER